MTFSVVRYLEGRVGMSHNPGEVDEWGSDQEEELATSHGGTAGLTRDELAKVRNREVCFALWKSNYIQTLFEKSRVAICRPRGDFERDKKRR